MKVKLINHTPNPELAIYFAAKTCYQAGSIDDIQIPKEVELKKFLYGLIKSGHTSTLEHASFTFAIEGVSRVVTHELVRHRIASYSQQSQRYVSYDDIRPNCYYVPEAIKHDLTSLEVYNTAIMNAFVAYEELMNAGVKPQDARYVLPNVMPTQIVVTMNARSLYNFFALRCCRRAQPEMQDLANTMLHECRKKAPILFAKAGRQCATCTEVHKPKECLNEAE